MKKLLLSFLFIAATGTALLAQKVINDLHAEKRTVSGYHGIDVATGIELTLTNGNAEEVAVSAATTEFRDKIVTKVENGILKIYYETKMGAVNKTKESKDLKAYVSYKTLDLLHVTTGAKVKINGVLKSASLSMEVNTGALVDGEVDIASLKVNQNTGSKVTLSGKADKLDINGDTGSKFKGDDMSTSNCNVTVSTGAVVSVSAEKELQAKASTGGSVKYKGSPTVKEIKRSTGGSVNKI
ncbi:MAG: head GIN domain-containing protein [Bacteroidota bacterium]|nr:head GIN domain-containing protein [Bacteroidota bacterium]